MEIVIVILMCLVSFSSVLKLTCLPVGGILLISLIYALFTGLGWESAIEQSGTQIADWLQNPELMLDMSVILTIDVLMQVSFCILDTQYLTGEKMSKTASILRLITLWIPGILIFPTLFACLVEVIFSFPGVDFSTLAWSLAAVVFIAFAVLPAGVKSLIPEKDLRLELLFMINILIALLGVVATINGRTAVAGTNNVDYSALISVIGLFALGTLTGLVIYKFKVNKLVTKIK